MANPYRAKNKRIILRGGNGRFRRATGADFGIGGTCPECQHFLLRHYDGDPRERSADPRKFRYRCFTCEPETEAELVLKKEVEDSRPKRSGFVEMLEAAAASVASNKGD